MASKIQATIPKELKEIRLKKIDWKKLQPLLKNVARSFQEQEEYLKKVKREEDHSKYGIL